MVHEGSNEGLNKAFVEGKEEEVQMQRSSAGRNRISRALFRWKAQTKKKKIHLLPKIKLRFYTKISLFQTYLDYRFRDTYLLFLDFP